MFSLCIYVRRSQRKEHTVDTGIAYLTPILSENLQLDPTLLVVVQVFTVDVHIISTKFILPCIVKRG